MKAGVEELHVVFSNHLDVGFNVRAWCDGDDGCTSAGLTKTGLPCRYQQVLLYDFTVLCSHVNG